MPTSRLMRSARIRRPSIGARARDHASGAGRSKRARSTLWGARKPFPIRLASQGVLVAGCGAVGMLCDGCERTEATGGSGHGGRRRERRGRGGGRDALGNGGNVRRRVASPIYIHPAPSDGVLGPSPHGGSPRRSWRFKVLTRAQAASASTSKTTVRTAGRITRLSPTATRLSCSVDDDGAMPQTRQERRPPPRRRPRSTRGPHEVRRPEALRHLRGPNERTHPVVPAPSE